MSDSQVLLSKIAALRQQLEQTQGLSQEEDASVEVLIRRDNGGPLHRLEQHVTAGVHQTNLLDSTLRQLSPDGSVIESSVLPRQLTATARRILEDGRKLLDQLRILADAFDGAPPTDTLADYYRVTAAMAETSLRIIQAFPDAPSAQLRLSQGLEAILGVIAERVDALNAAVVERREEADRVDTLADLLRSLHSGKTVDLQAFVKLAESLVDGVQQAAPLRFLTADAGDPARFAAGHGLTVAAVVARLTHRDPEFRNNRLDPVLAALLHDAGMLSVPASILAQPEPLDDTQRRTVEAHAEIGAEMIMRLLPGAAALAEATAQHHERLDGTGYPAGLRDNQISSLGRLLAVCDVYTALASTRPHRHAFDTRTALTDTLLLAERGLLDRQHAERLLLLSFYPVGSVVELADGAVALVVGNHMRPRDLNSPARPVVALLTDSEGRPLPAPRHVDMAQCEGRSITRTLPPSQRRQLLGKHYPELS
ncbi:MAG TPA: HD domain-containing phosphohydrolase [Gemmataceae bacterium]|nr:HD domain-containing phosphohydrolase [Gemmataceae bacterium]